MLGNKVNSKELASIQYVGSSSYTQPCIDAIQRYVQFGDRINSSILISGPKDNTNCRDHGFILTINANETIAVKVGFRSGYLGEAPKGLAYIIQLLERHSDSLEEIEVKSGYLARLNLGLLSNKDIECLIEDNFVRPQNFFEYTYPYIKKFIERDDRYVIAHDHLNKKLPPIVPYGIIDPRITDLAITLFENSDSSINTAYRRLEDIVRERSGLVEEYGNRLFSRAFLSSDAVLHWADDFDGERVGKAKLFTSIFGAFRNRRAHREIEQSKKKSLREFLMINELFLLEKQSTSKNFTSGKF